MSVAHHSADPAPARLVAPHAGQPGADPGQDRSRPKANRSAWSGVGAVVDALPQVRVVAKVVSSSFLVPGRDGAKAVEAVEEDLDEVALPVECPDEAVLSLSFGL